MWIIKINNIEVTQSNFDGFAKNVLSDFPQKLLINSQVDFARNGRIWVSTLVNGSNETVNIEFAA